MNKGLDARLRRLERRQDRRPFPRVIFRIFDTPTESIIGYEGERDGTRLTILRQPGEALETLQARAWELVGSPFLFTLYGPTSVRQSDAPAPPDAPAPEPAPVDLFALAGIGRRASRDELIRMGAISVPPERLVRLLPARHGR